MAINWNETLLGPEDAGALSATARIRNLVAAARAARFAGMLAAVLLLAGSFAALPNGLNAVLPYLLSSCILLIGHVIGFIALQQAGTRALMWLGSLTLLGTLPLLGTAPLLVGGMAGIIVMEGLWLREVQRLRARDWQIALPIIAFAWGMQIFVLSGGSPVSALFLLASFVPLLCASLQLRRSGTTLRQQRAILAQHRKAIADAALARLPTLRFVTDASGRIDREAQETHFSGLLADSLLDAPSLVDQVLIADRPTLLQALSRAIHHGEETHHLTLRLRVPSSAALPLAPPAYRPKGLMILPLRTAEPRALVLIDEVDAATDRVPLPAQVASQGSPQNAASPLDHDVLARALHDAVAPFNAGLGYLEMIADPRLAPHDLAVFRTYAREAMGAVREAHRNMSLLGRWLRADQTDRQASIDVHAFGAICQDAMRALQLSSTEDRCEYRVADECQDFAMRLPAEHARFVIAVMLRQTLRSAAHAGRVTLRAEQTGGTLTIRAEIEPAAVERASADMFQHALEQMASQMTGAQFSSSAGTLTVTLPQQAEAAAVVRLAS